MSSQAAWTTVSEMVTTLGLAEKLDLPTLDNLKGQMADALDRAWNQGFEDAQMSNRLQPVGLVGGPKS